MSQCCGKVPTNNDVKDIKDSVKSPRVSPHGNSMQGDIGEQVAAEVVCERLNVSAEFYDAPKSAQAGIDSIYRSSSGKLVLVEAKFTDRGGLGSLGMTAHGRQGSVEWVRHHAELMCDPSSSRYSPDNAKIGEEILRVGAENVAFYVVHTDPHTLETDITKLR